MSELFHLSEDISITKNLVAAIGRGCPASPDMPDPVASIEFLTPADKSGYWVLSWFSKKFAAAAPDLVFCVSGVELFLSADTQSKLRGKIIDIENGRIVFSDFDPSTKR